MKRILAVGAVVAALAAGFSYHQTTTYQPLGFGGMGRDFGRLGANPKAKASAPVASCSGTGLIFNGANGACNSQYIGIL